METSRIVHLRLINSDEVIGEMSGESKKEIFIKCPMLVTEVTDDKTKVSTILLSKYVLFEQNTAISFSKGHVITTTDILDEIKTYYYNSIQYNFKFIEPVVRQELSKVNAVMENILKQSAYEPVLITRPSKFNKGVSGGDDVIVGPYSNTHH